MDPLIKITKALADPSRLRLLHLLGRGEICVCHLVTRVRLAPSTVSKHLSILENAGLISVRREGRWAYYRLARPSAEKDRCCRTLLGWLLPALEATYGRERLSPARPGPARSKKEAV